MSILGTGRFVAPEFILVSTNHDIAAADEILFFQRHVWGR